MSLRPSAPTPPPTPTPAAVDHLLGPVDQIPFGEARAFDVAGEQVAVFRLRDGRLRALSAVCTHRGGPIADGLADAHVVICPLHQHAFDLGTGCSTSGVAPLRVFDVRLEDDQVVVSRR